VSNTGSDTVSRIDARTRKVTNDQGRRSPVNLDVIGGDV
jgi:hypothetical protein